jgi:hypothetical protein
MHASLYELDNIRYNTSHVRVNWTGSTKNRLITRRANYCETVVSNTLTLRSRGKKMSFLNCLFGVCEKNCRYYECSSNKHNSEC